MTRPLFHIVPRPMWDAAVRAGRYTPESLTTQGFVHCSFAEQVQGVYEALYRDVADLVVVELDPDRVAARIVVEDSYGAGQEFPHIYGPVPTDAAVAVRPLTDGGTGPATVNR